MTEALGALSRDFMFVGGIVTSLLINDELAPEVRETKDVDCVVDVVSFVEYKKIEKMLQNKGFKQHINEKVICRWRLGDLILDIIPTNEKIIGFSNPWYKEAMKNTIKFELDNNKTIDSINAPYFIATKFAAFNERGRGDIYLSHDLEDIISIIDGRESLFEELNREESKLKKYIKKELENLMTNDDFKSAFPGMLGYGNQADERASLVWKRMEKLL